MFPNDKRNEKREEADRHADTRGRHAGTDGRFPPEHGNAVGVNPFRETRS
jgi:hypothetical protein